ncbi:hypothetical protein TTHERM_000887989 (macronuclear) [Tetrahymena thermophila SB210]|uniref:Uncharacterized protein n=1 Tax=Tetrahymena thermophila (strain SB210) TaxID=312017 RepID=W7XAE1_TETTS|nr:hypothetical protein TTHERM_000887989 [Tetrahymena thermophila SB210]EWS73358.1 hypothetical protein TTHERM_000887989 [Tetrahymena thermophila SB210]|eukprot:XP_012654091.1 hypothetical protein TTHERM_000887989 [Tetrahymena thermophila SB210]
MEFLPEKVSIYKEWIEMQVLFNIKRIGMYTNNNKKTSKQILEEEEEFQKIQKLREENQELYNTIKFPKKVSVQDTFENIGFNQQIEPQMNIARIRSEQTQTIPQSTTLPQSATFKNYEVKVSKRATLFIYIFS